MRLFRDLLSKNAVCGGEPFGAIADFVIEASSWLCSAFMLSVGEPTKPNEISVKFRTAMLSLLSSVSDRSAEFKKKDLKGQAESIAQNPIIIVASNLLGVNLVDEKGARIGSLVDLEADNGGRITGFVVTKSSFGRPVKVVQKKFNSRPLIGNYGVMTNVDEPKLRKAFECESFVVPVSMFRRAEEGGFLSAPRIVVSA